jgi:hypothetical protein
MSKAKVQRAAQPSVGGFLTPRSPAALVAAKPKMQGSNSMNDNFETRKIPLPQSHEALDHIRDAINSVINCQRDPYYLPMPGDLATLRSILAAFGYGRAITEFVLSTLEDRLAGNCDQLNRFWQRYGE